MTDTAIIEMRERQLREANQRIESLMRERDLVRKALEEIDSITRLTATIDHTHCIMALKAIGEKARETRNS